MKTNLAKVALVAGLALVATGLSGCGDSGTKSEGTGGASASQSEEAEGSAGDDGATGEAEGSEAEVEADLVEAKRVVDEALAEKGDQPSIYLASDVKSPEQKYGMWVFPYHHSDATEKVTETVAIENGKYEIVAVSATTGVEYVIDQDGKISQK